MRFLTSGISPLNVLVCDTPLRCDYNDNLKPIRGYMIIIKEKN